MRTHCFNAPRTAFLPLMKSRSILVFLCTCAWLFASAQQPYSVQLIESLCTPYDELACTVQSDRVIITTNRPAPNASAKQWNERRAYHLCEAVRGTSFAEYTSVVPLFPQFALNDEGTASWSPSDSTLYFSSLNNYSGSKGGFLKLFFTQWNGTSWSTPHLLPFSGGNADDAHPCFDARTKALVFCSNREGGSGDMDLWFVYKTAEGWGMPVNPGMPVNTPQSELYPTTFNGDIYYSSNGFTTGGGYDLFVTPATEQWSISIPLPSPINTRGDELMLLWLNNEKALLSSRRTDGAGGVDVYQCTKNVVQEAHGFTARLELEEAAFPGVKVSIANALKETVVTGTTDAMGHVSLEDLVIGEKYTFRIEGVPPVMYQEVRLLLIDRYGRTVRTLKLNSKGEIELELLPFNYTALRLLDNVDRSYLNTTAATTDQVAVGRSRKNKKVDRIYYPTNSAALSTEAKAELEVWIDYLKSHPKSRVELLSHTDSRGDAFRNQELSERRAEVVYAYLVAAGISPERISAKGMGETAPAVMCDSEVACTEETLRLNRRTEIKITEP